MIRKAVVETVKFKYYYSYEAPQYFCFGCKVIGWEKQNKKKTNLIELFPVWCFSWSEYPLYITKTNNTHVVASPVTVIILQSVEPYSTLYNSWLTELCRTIEKLIFSSFQYFHCPRGMVFLFFFFLGRAGWKLIKGFSRKTPHDVSK